MLLFKRVDCAVTVEDYESVLIAVERGGAAGRRIPDTTVDVAAARSCSMPRARYIVRAALDRGIVRTDRHFRLHVEQLKAA